MNYLKIELLYWKIIKLWHALAFRYSVSHKLTEKSDTCSFRIIILEIITSWPVIERSHNENTYINQWMRIMLALGDIQSIVDQKFHWDFNVIAAWKGIEIAMVCVSLTSTRRLTMSLVMAKLKECLRQHEYDFMKPVLQKGKFLSKEINILLPLFFGHNIISYKVFQNAPNTIGSNQLVFIKMVISLAFCNSQIIHACDSFSESDRINQKYLV